MGTWAIDAFGNDEAADWLFELYDGDTHSVMDKTLTAATIQGYLEAPFAQQALAAAEVMARLQGRPDTSAVMDEELDGWIKDSKFLPTPDLIRKAHGAIDRILSDDSELLELWQESEEFEQCKASVLNLRSRIR